MEEEREQLYLKQTSLRNQLDQLMESTTIPHSARAQLERDYLAVTKQLRETDHRIGEAISTPPSTSKPQTHPFDTFRAHLKQLLGLAQSKERLRDLFFGRPRQIKMALLFEKSGAEAKKLLFLQTNRDTRSFLEDWINEVEKTKNPDLYQPSKIEVYHDRFEKLYARIPPGVGGG